jgi:DNA repair protein RadC
VAKPSPSAQPAIQLREALAPYITPAKLRRAFAATPEGRADALSRALAPETPEEVRAYLLMLADLLRPTTREQIKSPADAAALLMAEMQGLDQEHLRAVLLDTKNRVLTITTVYVGSVNSAMIRVGEVFKEAIRLNAVAMILTHNHPSGDCSPSPEDILVTRQIVEAGKLLDCDVLDHLIIGGGRYCSMRERGLGFS